jgi:hypothetical protein
MQRNTVAFAVDYDFSKAIRADLVPRLDDLASVWLDGRNGLVQASLAIEIEQHTFPRRGIDILVLHGHEAA